MIPHHPEARFQSPAELVAHCRAEYERVRPGGYRRIIAETALRHGVRVRDIVGSSGARQVQAARREAIVAVAGRLTALTPAEIGAIFGGRHEGMVRKVLTRAGKPRRSA